MKDIHDVIQHAKFGDDRFRGSGVVAGQISAFPIDFAGRPYNTLTLPCERVIHLPYRKQKMQLRRISFATGDYVCDPTKFLLNGIHIGRIKSPDYM